MRFIVVLLFLFTFIPQVFAGVEFEDHFADLAHTEALDGTVPDTTGTGWTEIISNGKEHLQGYASLYLTTSSGLNDGAVCQTDDTMSHPDYEVEVVQVNGDTGNAPSWLLLRIQDSNNMYAMSFNESAGYVELWEKSTTWSLLDSTYASGIVDGSTVKLKAVGTTISGYDDEIEMFSITDSSHSGAGHAGVGMGDIGVDTGDDMDNQRVDNFVVTVTGAAATGAPQVITIMSEKEKEEQKKEWVIAKFKEDYASGKIKE